MPEAREYPWKNIGDRIREARTKLGLTQKELASGRWGLLLRPSGPGRRGGSSRSMNTWRSWPYRSARSAPPGFWAGTCWRRNCSRRPACPSMTAVEGLPLEDIETIQNFINFVRQERRRRTEAGE